MNFKSRSVRASCSTLRKGLLIATSMSGLLVGSGIPARAADATASADAAASTGTIEMVVVTARRREEDIKSVPISMQAFTEKDIHDAQIQGLQDVAVQSGFTFQEGASTAGAGRTYGSIIFRGLEPTYGGARENSGSLFIDGIFISGGQSSVDTTDVQRIEVLKGPQNVYFGVNTFGGAVNFITKQPSDTFDVSIDGSGTSRGSSTVDASVEGPLIDGILTGRLTLNEYDKAAEYHTSDGGDLGAERTVGGTATLYATPLPDLWMRFRAHYQEDNDSAPDVGFLTGTADGSSCAGKTFKGTDAAGNPVPVTLSQAYFCNGHIPSFGALGVSSLDQNTALPPGFSAALNTNAVHDTFLGEVPHLYHSGLRRNVVQLSYQAGYALPDGFDLAFSAGYNSAKSDTIWDVDRGTQLPPTGAYFISAQPVIRNDVSLDARVSSDQTQRLRGLFGISYFSSIDHDSQIDYGNFTGFTTATNTGNYINDYSSVGAVYGSVDFDIFSFLTATAEARYQHEGLTSRTYGGVNPLSKGYSNFLPRAILKFHPDETSDYYVSYSEGVQPQVANSAYAGLNAAQKAYVASVVPTVTLFSAPPKLASWEVGAKKTLFDGRVQFAVAAYDERWTGQLTSSALFNPSTCGATQLTPACPLAGSGTYLYLPNNAHIRGVELTGEAVVIDNLDVGFELDYKDARWTKFYNSTLASFSTTGVSYFDGNALSRVPALSGEFHATYRDHLIDQWDWYTRADVIYTGSMWESDINIAKTNAFARVNLRLGVDEGNLNLEIYGKNVFNNKDWDLASRVVDFSNSGGGFGGFAREGVLVLAPDQQEFGIRFGYKLN